MSLDRTEIANNALTGVGEGIIQDIDDNSSPRARQVKVVYEQALRACSRMHQWNCLLKRRVLGQDPDSVDPTGEWEYAYRLPEDCLKLIKVNGVDVGSNASKYSLEGRHILTDSDEAKVLYVAYNTDSSIYDALFTSAFIVYLSSQIARIIRQDDQVAEMKMEEFKETLSAARAKDGNERRRNPNNQAKESSWVNSRFYSTNG